MSAYITFKKERFQSSLQWLASDGRHYQILFQIFFLIFGITMLDWQVHTWQYVVYIGVCLATQFIFSTANELPLSTLKSGLISSFSLCLMLHSSSLIIAGIAAFIAIASKFVFRVNGKHIFNPANIAICSINLLTGKAWISPGQWGSAGLLVFVIGTLGFVVLNKVKRFDTAFAFFITFAALMYYRIIIQLNWELDFYFHQLCNGSLLLFTFFMITDPVSTPSHKTVRVVWSAIVAWIAYILQVKYFINGAPVWALFIASLFTPLLDFIFKAKRFSWFASKTNAQPALKLASVAVVILLTIVPKGSSAFCGFYVAKSDVKLFNKTSQVILVRDGEKTTITMSSDFKGDAKDFAMVVPVPVVLKKNDIKVVERVLFDQFDAYSSARLVEYWDENPCFRNRVYEEVDKAVMPTAIASADSESKLEKRKYNVSIEAKYAVGEYDILILNAKESNGLKAWLTDNGYQIPDKADEVLEPYINSNMKFFVVKVNMDEMKSSGLQLLRPLQISFSSPKFMLPLRLGMANANDKQDMIVYGLSKKGRIETVNYRTVNVPAGEKVPEFVQTVFAKFYADVYQQALRKEGMGNIFLEYAWDISGSNYVKCDPCVSTPPLISDLRSAGVDWLTPNYNGAYDGNVFFTRLHVTYDRKNFPQDMVLQETPNRENFQARYIITHPAQGDLSCDEARSYRSQVRQRRVNELNTLSRLTNWDVSGYTDYLNIYQGYELPKQPVIQKIAPQQIIQQPVAINPPSNLIDTSTQLQIAQSNDTTEEQAEFTPVYMKDDDNGLKKEKQEAAGIGAVFALLIFTIFYLMKKLADKNSKQAS